jgi:hypothetical protein
MDVKRLATDPAEFRRHLAIPTPDGSKPWAAVAADFQRRDAVAISQALLAVMAGQKPPTGRFWIERTKGASKDTDLASLLLHALAFAGRALTIQVGAADAGQADELRKAAKGIMLASRWLLTPLELQANSIINTRTGARLDIIPADAAGSHGARPDVVVLNELTHIGKREFAETLLDNAAKMPNGVVIIATNAGHLDTWQHEWRQTAIDSPSWYFSRFAEPAPWLDPAHVDEASKRSPSRYARLFQGVWTSGDGDTLPHDQIAAAVTMDGPLAAAEPCYRYVGGLDIGVVHDRTGFVVVGLHCGGFEREHVDRPIRRESHIVQALRDIGELPPLVELPPWEDVPVAATGRIRLARVWSWKAPPGGQVRFDAIEDAILEAHRLFKLETVAADWSQAAMLCQRLNAARVPVEICHPTAANLNSAAVATAEALNERLLDLYADERLLAGLRAGRIVERPASVRLEFPRTADGHADEATALSLALHACSRFRNRPAGPPRIDRPILSYAPTAAAVWNDPAEREWWDQPSTDLLRFDR